MRLHHPPSARGLAAGDLRRGRTVRRRFRRLRIRARAPDALTRRALAKARIADGPHLLRLRRWRCGEPRRRSGRRRCQLRRCHEPAASRAPVRSERLGREDQGSQCEVPGVLSAGLAPRSVEEPVDAFDGGESVRGHEEGQAVSVYLGQAERIRAVVHRAIMIARLPSAGPVLPVPRQTAEGLPRALLHLCPCRLSRRRARHEEPGLLVGAGMRPSWRPTRARRSDIRQALPAS
jgi:hypothetical protein